MALGARRMRDVEGTAIPSKHIDVGLGGFQYRSILENRHSLTTPWLSLPLEYA